MHRSDRCAVTRGRRGVRGRAQGPQSGSPKVLRATVRPLGGPARENVLRNPRLLLGDKPVSTTVPPHARRSCADKRNHPSPAIGVKKYEITRRVAACWDGCAFPGQAMRLVAREHRRRQRELRLRGVTRCRQRELTMRNDVPHASQPSPISAATPQALLRHRHAADADPCDTPAAGSTGVTPIKRSSALAITGLMIVATASAQEVAARRHHGQPIAQRGRVGVYGVVGRTAGAAPRQFTRRNPRRHARHVVELGRPERQPADHSGAGR